MGRRILAFLMIVLCLVVAGCSGGDSQTAGPTKTSQAAGATKTSQDAVRAVARSSAVAIGSDRKVIITAAKLDSEQTSALKQGWSKDLTVNVGVPVQIVTDGPLPAGGIRLSRTYQQPLPEGITATMAYFDEKLGTWHAVSSALSADRRTVTAVVHHLSSWTDVTGAVGAMKQGALDSIGSAADWAYYQVGKVFDTRVDPPSCAGKPPWLKSSVFIETNRNNPLLFCVGSDPKNSPVVDVKVRVNRGFAYNAFLGSAPNWTYNSTFQGQSIDDAIAAVGHLDQDLSQTWSAFSPKGSILVGAGQELSFGATEQQIRDMGSRSTVLRLGPPSTVSFLVSTLGRLFGSLLQMKADGYVGAAIAVSGCYSDVKGAHDSGTWARAAITCLDNLDEATAKTLAVYLTKRGADPSAAGKTAGALVGRASIYLALIGPTFSTMNLIGEQALPDSARTVDVYPTIEQMNANTLKSAHVPADCGLPAQRLQNNQTTQGSPGSGSLVQTVGYADFAGLGYKQALTGYMCSAGGVSWPEDLVLIGASGKLLASLNLGSLVRAEHSDLNTVSVSGSTAKIDWDAYEGAGFFFVHQSATVSYKSSKLVLSNHVVTYTPEAVASDILVAQSEKQRNSLQDPSVVTDAQWQQLTNQYSAFTFTMSGAPGTCTTSGSTASCPFDGTATGPVDVAGTMTLQKAPGTRYGWQMTNLQLAG